MIRCLTYSNDLIKVNFAVLFGECLYVTVEVYKEKYTHKDSVIVSLPVWKMDTKRGEKRQRLQFNLSPHQEK